MRSTYEIINNDLPYFITSTIIDWLNVFTKDIYFKIILDNFNFYMKKYKIETIAYVIMPNHFHAICNCRELKKAVQYIKSFSAKEIIDQLTMENESLILSKLSKGKSTYKSNSNYQVWQEGFHPKLISNSEMLAQKINYIHENPIRKGLVSNPEEWKYSSARYYHKDEYCGIKITRYI